MGYSRLQGVMRRGGVVGHFGEGRGWTCQKTTNNNELLYILLRPLSPKQCHLLTYQTNAGRLDPFPRAVSLAVLNYHRLSQKFISSRNVNRLSIALSPSG